MDYKIFYDDLLAWIAQVNLEATRTGMGSAEFWQWVADSSGAMCRKYQENRLVIKQMVMMFEWLEEVHEKRSEAK